MEQLLGYGLIVLGFMVLMVYAAVRLGVRQDATVSRIPPTITEQRVRLIKKAQGEIAEQARWKRAR